MPGAAAGSDAGATLIAGQLTVNALLVAGVRAPLDAVTCLPPGASTLSAANVATPKPSLATAAPPLSVPLPTSARDTGVPATALPNASLTRTWTAGVIVTPATTALGPVVKLSALAAAGAMVSESARVAVSPTASVASTMKLRVPASVALPDSAPVPPSSTMPAGRLPPTIVQP